MDEKDNPRSKQYDRSWDDDDFHEAVTAHVKQGNQKGWVPLADLEVASKSDPNYWAVREYVVWSANR